MIICKKFSKSGSYISKLDLSKSIELRSELWVL